MVAVAAEEVVLVAVVELGGLVAMEQMEQAQLEEIQGILVQQELLVLKELVMVELQELREMQEQEQLLERPAQQELLELLVAQETQALPEQVLLLVE
jgi:hypothetical protein